MKNQKKKSNIETMFPLLRVDRNLIVSKQGDLTACFELDMPEIFSLSKEQYQELHAL